MTEPLVTIAQANDHLHLDLIGDGGSPEDFSEDPRYSDVLQKIEQATDAVLDYLKVAAISPPKWTIDDVPLRVQAAILMALKSLYDDRDNGKLLTGLAGGDLANPIVALVYRLRDPSMA